MQSKLANSILTVTWKMVELAKIDQKRLAMDQKDCTLVLEKGENVGFRISNRCFEKTNFHIISSVSDDAGSAVELFGPCRPPDGITTRFSTVEVRTFDGTKKDDRIKTLFK